MPKKPRPTVALLVLCALGPGLGAARETAAAGSEAGWRALTELRQRLEAGSPLVADFEQTFFAAGFDTGDSENGRVYLDLPACLRWDYGGDFPNSFLLCGHLAHGWNEGETSGRRQILAEGQEPGLDLLRLEIDELRRRYEARLIDDESDGLAVELVAGDGVPGEVRRATLAFRAGEPGPRALTYVDVEGNRTRFEFGPYVALADRRVFSPPAELEWLTD